MNHIPGDGNGRRYEGNCCNLHTQYNHILKPAPKKIKCEKEQNSGR